MANSWGELSWSVGPWGQQNDGSASLTGIELTASLGNESVQIDVAPIPTGIELITDTII